MAICTSRISTRAKVEVRQDKLVPYRVFSTYNKSLRYYLGLWLNCLPKGNDEEEEMIRYTVGLIRVNVTSS